MLFIIAEGFRNLLRAKFTGLLTIISMIFALFLVSITAVIFQTMRLNIASIQNSTTMWVYFPATIPSEKSKEFHSQLEAISGVSSATFISKENGIKEFYAQNSSENSDDIIKLIGHNPIPDTYILGIKARPLTEQKLAQIKKDISSLQSGIEIRVKANQLQKIQTATKTLMKFLGGLAILIIVITIILVYNTIRLSIHAKKDTIRTMQLVGAKNRFIRSPFIVESLFQSIFSTAIVLAATLYLLDVANALSLTKTYLVREIQMHRFHIYGIVACAIVMSYFGATLSVRRYLKAA